MKNVIPFLLLLLAFTGFAQQQPNALALKVKEAKGQKSSFSNKPSLFQFAGQSKSASQFNDMVSEGNLLNIDLEALKSFYKSGAESLELELPNGSGKPVRLELVKHQLLTEDFSVVTSTSNGQPIDYQPGVYYWGIVKGDDASIAAISVFEDEIIGVISTPEVGNMVLGRSQGAAKTSSYIFYKENDLLLDNSFECGAGEEPVSEGKTAPNTGNEKVAKCVRAYLEAEYDLVNEKGGATGATNFLTGLFNSVAAAYQAEAITTYISQIFTWTTPDPYNATSTSTALTLFRNYRTTYNGDVAHLVSRGNPTGGGIAWVDALCTSYAYAYSYIYSTYNQFPTYSWSVNVIAHEMGHNLGSPHTHACAWNGNNTAIDGCGPAVGANEGCNASIPPQGTMMSYCHLVSGVGINFSLGFGPQPGDRIRSRVTAANCLTTCSSQCLTVTTSGANVNCAGSNTGTATASPSGGTGSYTYLWSNGGTTQTISNLAAGTYMVTVSAGSNCTGTASRIVTAPSAISTSVSVTNANNGQNNGAINLTVSGGTPGYSFAWSNGMTTEDISGLAPGNYTVTVTDANGCTATKSATVGNSSTPPLSLSFSVTNTNSGQSTGAINLTVTGGIAPYSYLWSNGATTEDIANLAAGTYTVTVTCPGASSVGSATVGTNSGGGGCNTANLPDAQSFEGNIGNWEQATNDQMDWTVWSGTTPTSGTGPNGAANGTYYVYTEANGNKNKTAYLLSPCYNIAGIGAFQTGFSYNMNGSNMGTLYFQYSLNGGTTWSTVWSKSGNQGSSWKSLTMNFTNNGLTTIRFRFYGKVGGGDKSDMAVDNFAIVQTGNLSIGEPDGATIELSADAQVEGEALGLSPNPVADNLLVSFFSEREQTSKLTVTDQTGRVILTQTAAAFEGRNSYQLDVTALTAGLYFLTVDSGQGRKMERFVVMH
jgi:hypothetical protein